MNLKIAVMLFLITAILIAVMPSESSLGESYKLIYLHVPITVITIGSLLLFPILHFKIDIKSVQGFSVATLIYSALHLVISSVFMYMAWGGLIFSEIRFVFSLTLFLFALTHSLLCFIDSRLSRAYSFFIYLIVPYFYLQLTRAEFQLHPTFVQMPALLYIPYFFSFPFVVMVYVLLKNVFKVSPVFSHD